MQIISYKKILFQNILFDELSLYFKKGILLTLPSAPGLASIPCDKQYHKALKNADFVLFDSGYFVLLLLLLKHIKVRKFSGFLFVNYFFKYLKTHKENSFMFVEPSLEDSIVNYNYLKNQGLISKHEPYIAPIYEVNNVLDYKLLNILKKNKPKYLVINIGGGIQEKLGYFLKRNLSYPINIICSGAAISFWAKRQAPTSLLLDKLYLTWLLRCIYKPKVFIKRYFLSIRLFSHVFFEPIYVSYK